MNMLFRPLHRALLEEPCISLGREVRMPAPVWAMKALATFSTTYSRIMLRLVL